MDWGNISIGTPLLGISSPLQGTTKSSSFPLWRTSQHEKVSRRKHVYEIVTLLGWGEGDCSWRTGEGCLSPEGASQLRCCPNPLRALIHNSRTLAQAEVTHEIGAHPPPISYQCLSPYRFMSAVYILAQPKVRIGPVVISDLG